MKVYSNPSRKPMMYGGNAAMPKKKKMQYGGMSSMGAGMMQDKKNKNAMGMMGMMYGSKVKKK